MKSRDFGVIGGRKRDSATAIKRNSPVAETRFAPP
jgi:hypothetical protein